MINYTYKINEEIARWATEIYIKKHSKLKWWIAFTNPTAGPWKTIVAPNDKGKYQEIYRFEREGERPDLILVNDEVKAIIIIEAKDNYVKLADASQMIKSIRVINDISDVLKEIKKKHWGERKSYRIIPSFLWACENEANIEVENESVRNIFDKNNTTTIDNKLLNVVIIQDTKGNLSNTFIYENKRYKHLDFLN
jgi:hypothetical protein